MVIVDRFSGWPEIIHCGATTGSSSLAVSRLRLFFLWYGVPEELSTDVFWDQRFHIDLYLPDLL